MNQIISYLKRMFVFSRSCFDSLFFVNLYFLKSAGSKLVGILSMFFSWSTRYSLIFDSKAATEQMIDIETCDRSKSISTWEGFGDLYLFSMLVAVSAAVFAANKWSGVKFARLFADPLILIRGSTKWPELDVPLFIITKDNEVGLAPRIDVRSMMALGRRGSSDCSKGRLQRPVGQK